MLGVAVRVCKRMFKLSGIIQDAPFAIVIVEKYAVIFRLNSRYHSTLGPEVNIRLTARSIDRGLLNDSERMGRVFRILAVGKSNFRSSHYQNAHPVFRRNTSEI